jgi:hypothetical protein
MPFGKSAHRASGDSLLQLFLTSILSLTLVSSVAAYSDGEIVETTAMAANDRHLFPSFFYGDSNVDPVLPLLEPNSTL